MPMLRRRALIIVPIALLLGVGAVRAMVFQSPTNHPLRALQPMFSRHPDALIDQAMRDIGTSAAKGGTTLPGSAKRAIVDAARQAPLAPEPFLVSGTMAQIAGDDRRAEALFVATRYRDPRAPAARYFLADRYLRTNRIAAGLNEMAVLVRLSEKASQPLGPALAAYAKTPGAIPNLRQFFRAAPGNRDLTLSILAQDPANTQLVLALAPPLPIHQVPPPDWQGILVRSLVVAGNFAAADDLWRRINGIRDRGLLYDPQFRDRSAAPPFNWQLASSNAGVAEAAGGGGLDVIYYGREETTFATQLLRLGPGTYRLAMRVEAPVSARGLTWVLSCATGTSQKLLSLPLDGAVKGVVAGKFVVPASDCPAQNIVLRGLPVDSQETAQVTVSNLSLTAAPGA
ncbi:MAG: hypothetical protein ABIR87_06260 [Sphingomicrobium sp.]